MKFYRVKPEFDNCKLSKSYEILVNRELFTVDGLKDQLKQIMQESGVDTLTGTEHKASYKAVTSSRIDTSALKRDMPAVAAQYSRTTETRRFTFS